VLGSWSGHTAEVASIKGEVGTLKRMSELDLEAGRLLDRALLLKEHL
jgi:hypothetical protein